MTARIVEPTGLDGTAVGLTSADLGDLSARLTGRVLQAGDAGWDDAVLVWNGMAAMTPSLVVQPHSAHDVAATVQFASSHRLIVSMKGGGHNIAGTAIAEGGLTMDMSAMRELSVDPDAKLVQVGPGCLLQDVDRATQAHGLATVLGFISEVGPLLAEA